jgi:hypothetical protein
MNNHLGLVLHVQVGNGSLYGYFNNPASQVSAHFWCAKDGRLEQYVDTEVVAWAEAAGNPNYLSVETEGFPTEPLTAAQVSKVAELLYWSASNYKFPIAGPVAHGQAGFTPHSNPNGTPDPAWGNHSCPDPIRLAQMADIIAAALPPLPVPIKEETMSICPLDGGGVAISAVGAGSRNEHLLVFTLSNPENPSAPGYNVLDVTTGIGTGDPYTVQSA